MQGLPTNLLTQNVATAKVDANSSVVNTSKVGIPAGEKSGLVSGETKGVFASFFESLLGNAEASESVPGQLTQGQNTVIEGKKEGVNSKGETLIVPKTDKGSSSESKIDELLKNKNKEQSTKPTSELTAENALSSEVLKNINNLIDKTPIAEVNEEKAVGEKVAATSSNLEQLLKTLKGENSELQQVDGKTSPTKEAKSKTENPLDFLIKESKSNDVGSVEKKNPQGEVVSKLGLSSEDFLSHLSSSKESKEASVNNMASKTADKLLGSQDTGSFDPNSLLQKQMNQSMKAYGQKQPLLNDTNIIRNAQDLMSKDSKMKSSIDELKSPDMKIGGELSQIKDPFIAISNNKQEQAQNAGAQGSEKVLDLSKMSSSNPTEVIKKISDYIQQSQVANKDQLDLTVKHDSLGQFKIQVNRPAGNNSAPMDMQITTSTTEGHDFFMKNEIGLMKNLSQAGIHLSDLRIVSEGASSSFAGADSRQQGNNSQYNSQNGGREFMSFDSQDSSSGSQRRKELWQEAQNQQRYGA